jgi:hypothetical protein
VVSYLRWEEAGLDWLRAWEVHTAGHAKGRDLLECVTNTGAWATVDLTTLLIGRSLCCGTTTILVTFTLVCWILFSVDRHG